MPGDIVEGFERHRVDRLDLQGFHQAFGLGIVVRIAFAPHRTDQAVGAQCFAIDFGGILRAAIGMVNAASRWLSPIDGSFQGSDRQAGVDRAADGVADDQT